MVVVLAKHWLGKGQAVPSIMGDDDQQLCFNDGTPKFQGFDPQLLVIECVSGGRGWRTCDEEVQNAADSPNVHLPPCTRTDACAREGNDPAEVRNKDDNNQEPQRTLTTSNTLGILVSPAENGRGGLIMMEAATRSLDGNGIDLPYRWDLHCL